MYPEMKDKAHLTVNLRIKAGENPPEFKEFLKNCASPCATIRTRSIKALPCRSIALQATWKTWPG